MKNTVSLLLALSVISSFNCTCNRYIDLSKIAIENLNERMNDSAFWNKIHSIEFLIDLGLNKEAEIILKDRISKYESEPQMRIGYWRCMALNENDTYSKDLYIKKILEVYLDSNNTDIIHAAESLAKLSFSLRTYPKTKMINVDEQNKLEAYVNWSSIYPDKYNCSIDYNSLFEILKSENLEYKQVMAYGTKYLGKISNYQWRKIMNLALTEPLESPIAVYLYSSALNSCPDQERNNKDILIIRDNLKRIAKTENIKNKYEAFVALGNFAEKDDSNFIKEELLKMQSLYFRNELNDQSNDLLSAMSFAYLKSIGFNSN